MTEALDVFGQPPGVHVALDAEAAGDGQGVGGAGVGDRPTSP